MPRKKSHAKNKASTEDTGTSQKMGSAICISYSLLKAYVAHTLIAPLQDQGKVTFFPKKVLVTGNALFVKEGKEGAPHTPSSPASSNSHDAPRARP